MRVPIREFDIDLTPPADTSPDDDVRVFRNDRQWLTNILFFAKDAELVQAVFRSALEFVEQVPVKRLTFVPDARVWELIE